MANYYYLVSTLPSLRVDMSEYMTFDAFLTICKDLVTFKDYEILKNASLKGDAVKGSKFIENFSLFRSMVEKETAHQRAINLKLDDEIYINKGKKESRVIDKVRQAVNQDNPLEGEKIILSLYWEYLESNVSIEHNFDLTFLISYALRLQILSRLSLFTQDKGNAEFSILFDKLKQEIFQ